MSGGEGHTEECQKFETHYPWECDCRKTGAYNGDDVERAKREASALAAHLASTQYDVGPPEWQPAPDLRGIISQIDNMTAGMVRSPKRDRDGVDRLASYIECNEAELAQSHGVRITNGRQHAEDYTPGADKAREIVSWLENGPARNKVYVLIRDHLNALEMRP